MPLTYRRGISGTQLDVFSGDLVIGPCTRLGRPRRAMELDLYNHSCA
jgi:hypothetical protein